MRGTKARHIEEYYGTLRGFERQGARSEGTVRTAFYELLTEVARPLALSVFSERTLKVASGRSIRVDGELRDEFGIQRGIWEAKDIDDNLGAAIAQKVASGYPLRNTLFENTRRGVLYQNGERVLDVDLQDPARLGELLDRFLGWTQPQVRDFHLAVRRFAREIPLVAGRLKRSSTSARRRARRCARRSTSSTTSAATRSTPRPRRPRWRTCSSSTC